MLPEGQARVDSLFLSYMVNIFYYLLALLLPFNN